MKALVKFALGPDGVEVREVPEPTPAPDQVKIHIMVAGICGTDILSIKDLRATRMPMIMGHEFVGRVAEVGSEVTHVKKGDWVVANTAVGACLECDFCKNGDYNICEKRQYLGVTYNGTFAEYMVLPGFLVLKVPDSVTDKLPLAVGEPFTCCIHGVVDRAHVKAGDLVVISGPGIMGLSCLQVAKAQGAKVIISGLPQDAERFELAKKFGVDAIATSEEELLKLVEQFKPGGADVAIDCATVAPSVSACIKSLRKRGTYLQIGVFPGDAPVNLRKVVASELTVTGSNATNMSSWYKLLELVTEKKIQLEPFVSKVLPLEEWRQGFDIAMSKTAYRVLLVPGDLDDPDFKD